MNGNYCFSFFFENLQKMMLDTNEEIKKIDFAVV